MADDGAAGGRYTAFLSYSHKDAAAARWLHRRLEAYRIPRRLVGTEGEHGPVPARLTPIFRDREELPAAGDLSEKVRAALALSDRLIVVCSPNSAASPWVAKEVAAFRELHPGRAVFAAIVEGDPPACFPAGLAEGAVEPLAADLRPGRDGRRLGLLKLVAGLAGIGLDALVQRDAARRVRRVTAVTAAAVAAMIVMVVLTVMAVQSRAEAQRQRAEAEGLVEFMLTDLRDRLRKVGRLDAMEAVNARALEYYRRREAFSDVPSLPEQSVVREARIFLAVGEDDLEQDNLAGALSAFRKARDTTRSQLALFPADAQLLLDYAKSLNGIGRVHELRHEWEPATLHYRAYAATSGPLAASALGEAAAAAINLGNVEAGQENYPGAERHYRRAVNLLGTATTLKEGDPHLLLTLANAQAWLADTYYRRGLWHQSLKERRRQQEVMTELARTETDSAEARFRHAAADRGLACSLWKTGDRQAAAASFIKAYKTAAGLTALDSRNLRWRELKQKLADDLLRGGLTNIAGVKAEELKRESAPEGAKGCTG